MIPKMPHKSANLYSPLTLAFLGDSVYETYLRTKIVMQANMPVNKLHSKAVKMACCEFQAKAVKMLAENGMLTSDELYIARRGKNANGVSPPKHSTALEYRQATGLECLFGYLYLTGNTDRLDIIFEYIWNIENHSDGEEADIV